jgi:serine/threonine protein kinase
MQKLNQCAKYFPVIIDAFGLRNYCSVCIVQSYCGVEISSVPSEMLLDNFHLATFLFGMVTISNLLGNYIAYNVITDALAYMHKHCLIHGDVKPNNVLINPDNKKLTLIDFSHSGEPGAKIDGTQMYASTRCSYIYKRLWGNVHFLFFFVSNFFIDRNQLMILNLHSTH